MNLDVAIDQIWGIGAAHAKRLRKLGIETARDLLFYFPRRYEDFSKIVPLSQLKVGEAQSVVGRVLAIGSYRTPRKSRALVEAIVGDETGLVKAVWFNQSYLTRAIKRNEVIILSGKVEFGYRGVQFTNPSWEKVSEEMVSAGKLTHTGRIVPIYSLTEGLTSRWLRSKIKPLLKLAKIVEETLPPEVLREENFPGITEALNQIHFPDSVENFERARSRFAFEELLIMQLAVAQLREMSKKEKAVPIKADKNVLKNFAMGLPFKLTNAQRRAAWEIIKDLSREQPMTRLLQGDVGSGKTVVAAIAILATVKAGYQAALMAPTEILAQQHYRNLSNLLEPFGVRIALVTSSVSKSKINGQISDINLFIGTHALLSDKIRFDNLALAIIDEQHRFGVEQRAALSHKSKLDNQTIKHSDRLYPHFLSMTATPIPRTLAMTVYGDLSLSVIDEMPAGRKKVISRVVSEANKKKAYEFVRFHVKNGNQVFVICPRIEEGLQEDVKSANEVFKKLSEEIFPDLSIGLLHGKLSSREKEKVMRDFVKGGLNILVSTSVVEVGVDVPNATIMWIEGAERFGLAQLHQLRGRVGRSDKQSFCLLFPSVDSSEINYRLNLFANCNDGFQLAEEDLKMRGPGDLWGTRQSGFPELKIASLTDYQMIKKAKAWADKIIADLSFYPALKKEVDEFLYNRHRE